MKNENKFIKTYYDKYSAHLDDGGYNERHFYIARWLDHFGVNPAGNVLEIGCGPGHSTINLIDRIDTGKIVGVDISSENIRLAKELHKGNPKVEYIVSDMSDFKHDLKFDLVLLPDVLEHILIEQHHELFKTIRGLLKDDGKVIINIPDPEYLEYLHGIESKQLQVVDQPIHTEIISASLKGTGLRITALQSYNIGMQSYDYQMMRLEPKDLPFDPSIRPWDNSLKSRIRRRVNNMRGRKNFH